MTDGVYNVKGAPEDVSLDHIIRADGLKGRVKCLAIRTTATCETARQFHDLSPAACAALGRFMTGSLLISESMKGKKDTQTTVIKCDGPIKGMTCVTDYGFKVRAYPIENNVPTEYLRPGKINVGAAVGRGLLTVIRDIGLREPYVGSTELVSGEIAEDFTYYLASSEQTPSVVSLGVLMEGGRVTQAGGMMIQLLPGASEEEISYLETRAGGFPEMTYLLSEGFSPAQILDLFMGDPDLQYLDGAPVGFECPCSKERMSEGLATLGRADLEELIASGESIETQCHFCNKKYEFSSEEIKSLLT